MEQLIGTFAAFLAAASFVVILTPKIARLAIRVGAVDHPDGRRKSQALPVPRGGGVVVALAAFLAVVFALFIGQPADSSSSAWLMYGLLPSAAILLIIGIIDDVLTLTGIYKLVGQVLAVSVLVAAGAQFDKISLFGLLFPLGVFRIPFTIFFCLGAINAFNLIDGVDALASSLGAIVCVTLGIITASQGHVAGSVVCFALAGGLIGFLRYNIAPAKVYLGDTGSMLIGLVVAAVAIESSVKQQTAFLLAVPLAICAIPILDAGAALVLPEKHARPGLPIALGGVGTNLERLVAQDRLLSTQLQITSERYDQKVFYLSLLRAVGALSIRLPGEPAPTTQPSTTLPSTTQPTTRPITRLGVASLGSPSTRPASVQ